MEIMNSKTAFLIASIILLAILIFIVTSNNKKSRYIYEAPCETEEEDIEDLKPHTLKEIKSYKMKNSDFVNIEDFVTLYSDEFIDIELSEKRLSKLILKVHSVADELMNLCIKIKFSTGETCTISAPLCLPNLQTKLLADFPEGATSMKIVDVSFERCEQNIEDIKEINTSRYFRMLSSNTLKYNGRPGNYAVLDKWYNITDVIAVRNGSVNVVTSGAKYVMQIKDMR